MSKVRACSPSHGKRDMPGSMETSTKRGSVVGCETMLSSAREGIEKRSSLHHVNELVTDSRRGRAASPS